MNTSKIALYTNPDEVLTLTPSESIISMFEHTDENGTLYIPEWPYDGNLHSVAANGRWCGDQRPPCGLKTAG